MQTLTKVYESHEVGRQVVDQLEAAGILSSSISLLANKSISDQYADVDDASEAGPEPLELVLEEEGITRRTRNPGHSWVWAQSWAAGWLASTVVGAVAGV